MKKAAFSVVPACNSGNFSGLVPALALICLILPACVVREGGGEKLAAATVDNSLITGSIKRSAPAPVDPQSAPDNAVILAKFVTLEQQNGHRKSLAWENTATGSRGIISALGQPGKGKAAGTCRLFQTTRESFDGIGLYKGEACRYGRQPWVLSFLREE
ncbi:MAG: hypothetical protein DU429_08035 [Candidatus Tokpelaia sp.]|uniref:RT0821/Lpp0805 family surface protein n=1 Tax=Candidatus Tokpelaia sp. TaxID=2233777 RepID=UPI00123AEF6F|nr:RT0821/Lpp0805 family surface protein [Candidatus Tokpelaia sp.]KAA6204453.1 MAG: hypothetical protein DU430_08535 [Candidatus Tokpelaia sp.]KAA6205391.1 MAG: hypothetical protein DU429_08035 [Candidatus Tokpelaia sp.]KAA6406139.1 hypothetical protein DPQ22_01525 [Candidatus Tokpelaia sp.]